MIIRYLCEKIEKMKAIEISTKTDKRGHLKIDYPIDKNVIFYHLRSHCYVSENRLLTTNLSYETEPGAKNQEPRLGTVSFNF
jgi:hypothetical protein